ncbi:MAG: alcohol dehydrogenase catalytic domain-containing protein [Terriglobales bacterium]
MNQPAQRWVARALRAGGPEVIEVGVEDLPPRKAGEVLVRVEAAGLNHAETLIRTGTYTVRLPFPYPLGGEGSGIVVAAEAGTAVSVGARVCWGTVMGSCATFDGRGPRGAAPLRLPGAVKGPLALSPLRTFAALRADFARSANGATPAKGACASGPASDSGVRNEPTVPRCSRGWRPRRQGAASATCETDYNGLIRAAVGLRWPGSRR